MKKMARAQCFQELWQARQKESMHDTVEDENIMLALRWSQLGGRVGLRKLGAVVGRLVTL